MSEVETLVLVFKKIYDAVKREYVVTTFKNSGKRDNYCFVII